MAQPVRREVIVTQKPAWPIPKNILEELVGQKFRIVKNVYPQTGVHQRNFVEGEPMGNEAGAVIEVASVAEKLPDDLAQKLTKILKKRRFLLLKSGEFKRA